MLDFLTQLIEDDQVQDMMIMVSDYTPLSEVILAFLGNLNNKGKKLFKIIIKLIVHFIGLLLVFWKYKKNIQVIKTTLLVFGITKILTFLLDIYHIIKIIRDPGHEHCQ